MFMFCSLIQSYVWVSPYAILLQWAVRKKKYPLQVSPQTDRCLKVASDCAGAVTRILMTNSHSDCRPPEIKRQERDEQSWTPHSSTNFQEITDSKRKIIKKTGLCLPKKSIREISLSFCNVRRFLQYHKWMLNYQSIIHVNWQQICVGHYNEEGVGWFWYFESVI
jgi:hypothetical protein